MRYRSKQTVRVAEQVVVDFDIETRPLGWYGGEFVHSEPTAIGYAYVTGPQAGFAQTFLLDKTKGSAVRMLKAFRKVYDHADMLTGHYIRGFDLGQLQAAYLENGLPLLGPKLTHDTKLDLLRFSGMSKSQQNIGSMFDTEAPKVVMTMADWREANRLTPEGLELTHDRVIGDVLQHMQMRRAMLDAGILGPPKMWYPATAGSYSYHA